MRKFCIVALIIALLATSLAVSAKCPPSGCGGGSDSWESRAQDFLNSDVPLVGPIEAKKTTTTSFKVGVPDLSANGTPPQTTPSMASLPMPDSRSALFVRGELLKPMSAASSSDLILDVSKERKEGQARVRGAINLPVTDFLHQNGTLKSDTDMAQMLGRAGLSPDDSVVVYSDSFSSGEAALMVWILRYLGHDHVKAMDGDLDLWKEASLPLQTENTIRNATNYSYSLRPELMADYGFVQSGNPQLIDARTFQEYGESKIPSATFVGPDQVLEAGRISSAENLNSTFARLDRSRPVVVYSQDLFNASLVWYALQLMGFDSRIYSWQDWEERRKPKTYVIG